MTVICCAWHEHINTPADTNTFQITLYLIHMHKEEKKKKEKNKPKQQQPLISWSASSGPRGGAFNSFDWQSLG